MLARLFSVLWGDECPDKVGAAPIHPNPIHIFLLHNQLNCSALFALKQFCLTLLSWQGYECSAKDFIFYDTSPSYHDLLDAYGIKHGKYTAPRWLLIWQIHQC
jgi:hypothetical protein